MAKKKIYKEIDLSGLPYFIRMKNGEEKRYIDWTNSVGYIVPFIYGDIKDSFIISKYCKEEESIYISNDKYKNNFKIQTKHIRKCPIGVFLEKHTKEFKVKIGQAFKDERRDLIITDREIKTTIDFRGNSHNNKYYKYTCNVCSWTEGWITESHLLKGTGCSCCAGRTAVLGINTVYDMNPWVIDLGVSEEDAKKYTSGNSEDLIEIVCPECGNITSKTMYSIIKGKTISCKQCGDGRSYPEKVMYGLLKAIGVDFETEYSPSYLHREENNKISKKRSDFYIPSLKLVIEMDGGIGHEGGIVHKNANRNLEYFIEIDKWKDEQHRLHDVKVARINCFKSEIDYIRKNILNSILSEYINMDQIDWNEINKAAIKTNRLKEVCALWNNGISKNKIAKELNVTPSYVNKLINKGVLMGWCNQNKPERGKKVFVYKDGLFVNEFSSVSKMCKKSLSVFGVKLSESGVYRVCNGQAVEYKGYYFSYERR